MSDDQQLAITDLHLRTLLDASPVGMLVFNDREKIILANQPAERLFGLGTQPLSTDRCGDLIRCANRLTSEKGCGYADACTTCPLLRGLRATIAGTATPTDQGGETLLDREPGCAPLWVHYRIRPLIIDSKRGALLTVDDITAQRQSEHQYTTLFREMLNAFALHEILCDDQGRSVDYRFLAINPAFERMTGLCAEQVVGRTVLEIFPGIEPFWIETYGQVALTGEPVHFQHYSRELNKHFSINAFCPTPGQFACLFADISERKKTEEVLSQQEHFLRSITSSTRDAILVMDNNGHISFWNPAAELIFGYTAEEALGAHLHRLIAPQRYHQAYERAFPAFQQTGEGYAIGRTIELDARHKSGQEFPIALSLSAFHSAQGWHTVGVIRDITERKKVEESLRESEERFKALHNASFGGIAIHDQGVILECNQGLSEISGFSKEELIGMDGLLLISEKTRGTVLENIRAGSVMSG